MPTRQIAHVQPALVSRLLYAFNPMGAYRGEKIQQSGKPQGRESYERTQKRHAEERPLGSQGQEPQASDCHRLVGGPQSRKESSKEDKTRRMIAHTKPRQELPAVPQ
jgi:hypothetical protein